MSTKTRLIIEVECGKMICADCSRRDEDYCVAFDIYLVEDSDDVFLRAESCHEAEAVADDLMLRAATAKAALANN